MNDEYTATVNEFLRGPHAEALEWLCAGDSNKRRLVEHRTTAQSIAFVEHLYAIGAEKVLAVDIHEDSLKQARCRYLLVELPEEHPRRDALFTYEREQAEAKGFRGTEDEGQLYVLLDVKGMN